jgi:DNA-binding MarR family transcriptional regulator/GNAT superfamily N-acetyltransferase
MDEVARVRRFNRTVTQRVGALDDRFLSGDRPLGEARLLWEVGDGRDVRELRAHLDLDSGYMSRLLRRLEADGLVIVGAGDGDRRLRTVRLTDAGRAERAVLDRRSDELAEGLLAPLNPSQRARLVDAMGEVERLLTAAMVGLAPADPESTEGRSCLASYVAELDRRFDGGFRASDGIAPPETLRPPRGVLLVATLRADAIGCGALRVDDGWAEIKSVWVDPAVRGLGVARRIIGELERLAAERVPVVRLDTHGTLREAIAMYRGAGYREIPRYNDNPYAQHWFEKRLEAQPSNSSGTTTS